MDSTLITFMLISIGIITIIVCIILLIRIVLKNSKDKNLTSSLLKEEVSASTRFKTINYNGSGVRSGPKVYGPIDKFSEKEKNEITAFLSKKIRVNRKAAFSDDEITFVKSSPNLLKRYSESSKNTELKGTLTVLSISSLVVICSFLYWPIARQDQDLRIEEDIRKEQEELSKKSLSPSSSPSSSYKFCTKHDKMYSPNNAYGGCPGCKNKEWEDEINKKGGFRDRVRGY